MGPYSNNPEPTGWIPQQQWAGGTPQQQHMGVSVARPREDWWALRRVAKALKIIAWVGLVFGVLVSLSSGTMFGSLGASTGGSTAAPALFITVYLLVITATGFVLTFGSAELILVFLAIEKNTRKGG